MSDPWLDDSDSPPPAPLPIIRKEVVVSRPAVAAPVVADDDEEDDGSSLWIEEDAPEPERPGGFAEPLAAVELEQDLPDAATLFQQMQASQATGPVLSEHEEDLPDPDALFQQMRAAGAAEELPDPEALFLQMQAAGAAEELPDPDALFQQMRAAGQSEELPDPDALFQQMQAAGEPQELPDPEALFLQMQAAGAAEELPDPDALFQQMRAAGEPQELPDPEALFLQMQAAGAAEELPDPDALFQQMQAAGEPQELPDPEALFLQMQAADPQEELPDPEALFLQMQASGEPQELSEPEALFLELPAIPSPPAAPEEQLEPDALFTHKRQPDFPSGEPDQGLFLRLPSEDTAPDDLPDPESLFLKMREEGPISEGAGFSGLVLRLESGPEGNDSSNLSVPEEPGGPSVLSLRVPSELLGEEDPPYSVALFPRVKEPEEEAPELSLLRDAPEAPPALDDLFQGVSRPGPMPGVDPRPLDLPPLDLPPLDLPSPDSGRFSGSSRLGPPAPLLPASEDLVGQDDLPDPDSLFQQMRALTAKSPEPTEAVIDDLPDAQALFLQMQAREAIAEPSSLEPDDLPDPNALFLQMQANLSTESTLEEPVSDWIPPLPEPEVASPRITEPEKADEKGGLFSRLKARFRGDKKVELEGGLDPVADSTGVQSPLMGVAAFGTAAALPDPAELFRRMQAESEEDSGELTPPDELFRRLESGEHDQAGGLPALPDLDELRAELEAEERARLDADLLGDLSGPERFADTVPDLAFNAGTFFQPPQSSPPSEKPEKRVARSEKLPPPRPPQPEEPMPAMLSRPESVPRSQPPLSSSPPQPQPARTISYQPSPAPTRRKSASTAIMPKDVPEKAAREKANLAARLAKYKARRKPLSRHTVSIFTRQMAAMLKAGISLHQAVSFCAESDPVAAPVLNDVCDKLGAGFSMSGALKEYPETFDAVFVGLVHAGELSGRLTEMLGKLADVLERELELRKRMISVITYPAVLMAVSLLGTLGFIFFVLPQLTPMFLDLKVDLPLPTQILLSLRTILLPLTVMVGAAGLTIFALKDKIAAYVHARPTLERRLAYFPLSIPVLGPVYDKMITARVLYSLATMLEVGVTMNQALARAEGTSGNAYVGYRLMRARVDLAEGASVTECFKINQVFPETALQLIAAGEESARLVDMFAYIARHFDEEVEQAMTAAAGLLEPVIMVVMGLIVGFITIAAALPTIKLLQGF